MSGLLALLDDVASLVKVAAASIDDVAGQAAKAGAKAAGIDSVLVLDGIHRDEISMAGGALPDEKRIGEIFARENQKPIAAIPQFLW